jgi:DNA polymerase I-like protein with 3'-5' exonuclease and polymerase domains
VQRGQAKRLAYGLLYGMGPQALAAELGVAVGEAVRLSDDFRRSHATLDAWMAVSGRHVLYVSSSTCSGSSSKATEVF